MARVLYLWQSVVHQGVGTVYAATVAMGMTDGDAIPDADRCRVCELRRHRRGGLCVECRAWQMRLTANRERDADHARAEVVTEIAIATGPCIQCRDSRRLPHYMVCRWCWDDWAMHKRDYHLGQVRRGQ